MENNLNGLEPKVQVCRHLWDHGDYQEWKPGCAWATKELLQQCEADGLLTVHWRDPDAIYPWSMVKLTAEGLKQARLAEWAAAQATINSLHPIGKAQMLLLTTMLELSGWRPEDRSLPLMYGPDGEIGLSVWCISEATGLTKRTIRRRARDYGFPFYKANNIPDELTAGNRGVDAMSMDWLVMLVWALEPQYIRDVRKRMGTAALRKMAGDVLKLLYKEPQVQERTRQIAADLGLEGYDQDGNPVKLAEPKLAH